MRKAIRSLWVVVLALASTVALAVAWTTATAVQLLATALIMGGTGNPLSTPPDDPVTYINPYMNNAINGYINPGAAAGTGTGGTGIAGVGPGDDRYAVITPEQFFPVAGTMTFDDSVVIGRREHQQLPARNRMSVQQGRAPQPGGTREPADRRR